MKKSKNIENPKYYVNYNSEVLFMMDHEMDGKRFIVIHSPVKYGKELERFYESINDWEKYLKEQINIEFSDKGEMLNEIESVLKPYQKCFKIQKIKTKEKWQFNYKLINKNIKMKTNMLGKTVLFTTTSFTPYEILKTYREKDVVEKIFHIMKKRGKDTLFLQIKNDPGLVVSFIAPLCFKNKSRQSEQKINHLK